ncbi:undecaprenyl-phosphate glucose phosphotransferase [bacterium]|nr:undecaprenyl-phosphate glucose phosphotransferase [bacterium]
MNSTGKIWLPTAALLLDAWAVLIGVWLAFVIRFSQPVTEYIPIITAMPPIEWYIMLAVIFAFLTLFSFLAGGLYRFPRQDSMLDELTSVIKYYMPAYTLMLAVLFFYRNASFSRLTMAILFLTSGGFLLIGRIFNRWLREKLYSLGVAVRRAAVVGDGDQAVPIVRHIMQHPEFGIEVVGSIGYEMIPVEGLKSLGVIENTGQTVSEYGLDTLIIAPAAGKKDVLPQLVRACYGVNVDFLYLPDIHPSNGRPKKVMDVAGIPLWTLKENPFNGWHGVVKRAADIVFSSFLILVASPLILIIAITVKIDSSGSVFYRQRRIGLDGCEFDCLKFRSMKIDAEAETGAVWAKPGDERVTRIGRMLRRWSMDELPQFWNVLKGDMSLVGPRPERPEFVSQFEKMINGYHERHRVRAGLTGWAQVNGLRGDTPIEERTKYDRFYVENWSMLFDLKIIMMTGLAIIKGENSY